MAKQEITKTTVEVKTGVRNSIKVMYPNGDVLKIVHTKHGHQVTTAGDRMRGQVSDATLCKILKFVGKYESNSETDTARFKRLGEFFEDTASINHLIAKIA